MVPDNYFVQLPQLEFTQYVLINTFRSRLHLLNIRPPQKKGRKEARDFSSSPVVKTLSFQIKVHGIQSLIREQDATYILAWPKTTQKMGGGRVNLLWGNLTNITSAK